MAFEREVQIAIIAKEKTRAAVKIASSQLKILQRTALAVTAKMKLAFVKAGAAIRAFGTAAKSAMRQFKVAILAALIAGAGLVLFIRNAIKAAKEQELAERKLEAAFLGSGKATRAGIESLKEYAAQLQKTTGFGDEQILNAQAMLATFALTDIQVKASTSRILDMAAATEQITGAQVDLQQIAIAVGKGLTGQVGILSRYGVVISDAVKKSGDFNEILAELDKNFKGIAETIQKGTFKGAMAGMSNAWSDLKEKIGSVITESDKFKGFLGTLQQGFERLQEIVFDNTNRLRELAEKGLLFFINVAVKAAKTGIILKASFQILTGVMKGLFGAVRFVWDAFKRFFKFLETLPFVGKHIKQWRVDMVDGLKELGDTITGQTERGGFIKNIEDGFNKIDAAAEKFGKKFVENTEKSKKATEELADKLNNMKGVTDSAGEAAEKMSDAQKKALDETAKAYESTVNRIHDTVSDLLFNRLTKKGQDFRDTMINIFRDIGDSIIRMSTNAATTAALNLIGIPRMFGGGGGIVGANRVIQTTAGGLTSGAGIGAVAGGGGAMISPAAAQMGMGVVASAGGRALTAGGGMGLSSAANIALAAGQGTFGAGGLSSAASLLRLGGSGLGAAIRTFPAVSQGAQRLLGFAGTRVLQGGLNLAGGIGSFAGSFLPSALGFQQTLPSSIGGAVGGLGGAIGGFALGGPIGAAIGGFGGAALGGIGGSLFGGGSNRNLPFGTSSFRDFGAVISSISPQLSRTSGSVETRSRALGIQGLPGVAGASIGTGLATDPFDAVRRINAWVARINTAETIVSGIEKALEGVITNAIGAGFQRASKTTGFETFIDSLKTGIMDNITSGIVAALSETTQLKTIFAKAIEPVTTFLAKQEKGAFSVEGFLGAISKVGAPTGLGEAKTLFQGVFGGLEKLQGALFGDSGIGAEAIRIPRLASGGQITKSGLAFVDKGERFSGVTMANTNTTGGNVNINLSGANINLSSTQEIRNVSQELGNLVKLEINKPRQFIKI